MDPAFNVYAPGCPSRTLLEHVTSRWGVLVLAALQERCYRFAELRRRVGGVSDKVLAQTLQNLVSDGLVDRKALDRVPPHVEYSLTTRGAEVAELLRHLVTWVETRTASALQSRASVT